VNIVLFALELLYLSVFISLVVDSLNLVLISSFCISILCLFEHGCAK
jgi:hypothetical protein